MRVLLEEDTVASARCLAVVHDAVAQPAGARADQRRAWRLGRQVARERVVDNQGRRGETREDEGRRGGETMGDEGRPGQTRLGGRPDTREAGAYKVAAPAESR